MFWSTKFLIILPPYHLPLDINNKVLQFKIYILKLSAQFFLANHRTGITRIFVGITFKHFTIKSILDNLTDPLRPKRVELQFSPKTNSAQQYIIKKKSYENS